MTSFAEVQDRFPRQVLIFRAASVASIKSDLPRFCIFHNAEGRKRGALTVGPDQPLPVTAGVRDLSPDCKRLPTSPAISSRLAGAFISEVPA